MKLRVRLILFVSVLYIFVGFISIYLFYSITNHVIYGFAERLVHKEAQIQKSKLMAIIDKEIVLSTLIADDTNIKEWVLNEADNAAKIKAMTQIDGYRKLTDDQTIFITIARSNHYYTFLENQLQFNTLYKDKEQDHWFFKAFQEIDNYRLNTDYDQNVNRTKIWINTIMRDNMGRKIAVVGSGVDISIIIKEIVETQEAGVSIYLIDDNGAIQATKNRSIVMQNAQALDANKVRIDSVIQNSVFSEKLKATIATLKSQKNPSTYLAQTFSFELMGRTQVAAISFMPHIGWYNVVLVDVGSSISSQEFLPMFLVLFLSLFILTVSISYFIHHYFLKPIEQLTQASVAVAKGDYTIRLSLPGDHEIGKLSNAFDSMTATIEDYTSTLESKVKERTSELQNANEALAKSQFEIQASIDYAAIIQSSILPELSLFSDVFSESFVWFQPKESVGGDCYYLRNMGNTSVLSVMDCTGHGVSGALMTMTAISAMNQAIDRQDKNQLEPATTITIMNRILKQTFRFKDIDAGLDLAICKIHHLNRQIDFSGAGLSLFQYKDGEVIEYNGDSQRVGYRASKLDYPYKVTTIDATDSLFFITTDGILDESGGRRGYAFGTSRLKSMFEQYGSQPMNDQMLFYQKEIDNYRGRYKQRDDQTLIGFRL